MARETLERSLTVAAPADAVWERLTDMTTVASWLPVVHSVSEVAPLQTYRAILQDKVGPFSLKADLDIDVTELDEHRRIAVHAAGEDRQVRSRITIDAAVEIGATDGTTAVSVSGTYEITGRVATLGASTIRAKARKMVDEFCVRAQAGLA